MNSMPLTAKKTVLVITIFECVYECYHIHKSYKTSEYLKQQFKPLYGF